MPKKSSTFSHASDPEYEELESPDWGFGDDWEDDYFDDDKATRRAHEDLCDAVKNGEVEITPELLQSIEDPDWRRELIEAICLRKVNQALEGE